MVATVTICQQRQQHPSSSMIDVKKPFRFISSAGACAALTGNQRTGGIFAFLTSTGGISAFLTSTGGISAFLTSALTFPNDEHRREFRSSCTRSSGATSNLFNKGFHLSCPIRHCSTLTASLTEAAAA